jgi:hypothetical protein
MAVSGVVQKVIAFPYIVPSRWQNVEKLNFPGYGRNFSFRVLAAGVLGFDPGCRELKAKTKFSFRVLTPECGCRAYNNAGIGLGVLTSWRRMLRCGVLLRCDS